MPSETRRRAKAINFRNIHGISALVAKKHSPYIRARQMRTTETVTQPSTRAKPDTFTFRLEPGMKAGLARAAAEARVRPAELVRELLGRHIAGQERRRFEAEARRQCLVVNAAAREPASDEARVARELEDDLKSFADEWR